MRLNKQFITQKIFEIRSAVSALKQKKDAPLTTAKTDVFIWGCNPFSLNLYHLLTRNNVNVIAFIENNYPHSSYCNKPVYKPEAFKTKSEYSSIPIVIAATHSMGFTGLIVNFESIRQFKLKFTEIITDHQIHNPLLHPAALLDVSNCTYPKKIIAFGIQGSGNTIYNHIFIKLIEAHGRKFKTLNVDAHFFEKLCYEYEQCLKQTLSDIIYTAGGRDIMIAPWNIGTSAAAFVYENKKSNLFTLPTNDHVTHRAYGYHNIPSVNTLEKVLARKFKLFLMSRNPLDIILSILKKRKGIDKNKQINFDLFCVISHKVVNELTHWSSYFSHLERLRYEDLMQNPVQQITNVMRKLGIRPSVSTAKKLWAQLGFKQLPQAPKNNFNGGGSGKWEQHFKSEHLAYLHVLGIQSVLELYGYAEALEKFREKIRGLSPHELQVKLMADNYAQVLPTLDKHEYALAHLSSVHAEGGFGENGCFYVGSDNPELVSKMRVMLDNEYVRKLVGAGRVARGEGPSLR